MRNIGIIKSIDVDSYQKYIKSSKETDREIKNVVHTMVKQAVDNKELEFEQEPNFSANGIIQRHVQRFLDSLNSYVLFEHIAYLRKIMDYAAEYSQKIEYVYADEKIVCMELPRYSYVIPREFVEIQPYQDYSDVPVARIGVNSDLSAMLPALQEEVTQNSVKEQIEQKQSEINAAINDIKKEQEAKKAEIERMKQEIEAKYEAKLKLLNQKKQELEEKKKEMESQLFVLDTQIYGIRCFFGETVSFTRLVSGREAAVEEPVVLHQKIRFLDEELAKYVALYDVDAEDADLFEEVIRHRRDMQELFFPGEKSISLVRISKDGKVYNSEIAVSQFGNSTFYHNVLKEYEVYHGKKMAILVRNGENCYIGWADEERIRLSDDNMFLTPKTLEETIEEKYDSFGRKVETKTEQTSKEEVASRYFIFSIMQGLVLNSKLIQLPENMDIVHGDNRYVVYSMADSWLKDTRYGTFSDIVKKYNGILRNGDMILTLTSLAAEGEKYRSYSNDRGIGYRNRTHDVFASSNTIYPVNLVENTYGKEYSFERRNKDFSGKYMNWRNESHFSTAETWEKFKEEPDKYWIFPSDTEFRNISVKDSCSQRIYISLEKDKNWRTGVASRANFELMSDEYINLTFLNSALLQYVIINRDLGDNGIFRRVNFSYIIPFLNHALEYLLEREKEEEKLISVYMDLPEDWQMMLSEWKMEQDVHKITDYQAKRFAAYCMKRRVS